MRRVDKSMMGMVFSMMMVFAIGCGNICWHVPGARMIRLGGVGGGTCWYFQLGYL